MSFAKDEPLYVIGVAANKIGVKPDRLRNYEKEGLIYPAREGKSSKAQRIYSEYEIEWLINLRVLLQDYNMNVEAVKVFIKLLYLIKQNNVTINPNKNKMLKNFKTLINNPVLDKVAEKI